MLAAAMYLGMLCTTLTASVYGQDALTHRLIYPLEAVALLLMAVVIFNDIRYLRLSRAEYEREQAS